MYSFLIRRNKNSLSRQKCILNFISVWLWWGNIQHLFRQWCAQMYHNVESSYQFFFLRQVTYRHETGWINMASFMHSYSDTLLLEVIKFKSPAIFSLYRVEIQPTKLRFKFYIYDTFTFSVSTFLYARKYYYIIE